MFSVWQRKMGSRNQVNMTPSPVQIQFIQVQPATKAEKSCNSAIPAINAFQNTDFIVNVEDGDHDGDRPAENANPTLTKEDLDAVPLLAYHNLTQKLNMDVRSTNEMEEPTWGRMVRFATISSISLMQSAGLLKFYMTCPTSVKNCIKIGSMLSVVLLKLSFIFAAIHGRSENRNINKALVKRRCPQGKSRKRLRGWIVLSVFLVTASFQCTAKSIQSYIKWNDWTLQYAVELRAYDLGSTVFVWTKNNTKEMENFLDSFSTGVNSTTMSLALISFIMDIVGIFHEYMIKGKMLATALSLKGKSEDFHVELQNGLTGPENHIPQKIWDMYEDLKINSKLINDHLWFQICFFTANCLMTGAFFLHECINLDIRNGLAIYLLIEIHQIVITFKWFAEAAGVNETFRNWIWEKFPDGESVVIGDNSKHKTMYSLMAELDDNPIGVKCCNTLIDSSFNIQCADIMYYFFMLLAATNEPK